MHKHRQLALHSIAIVVFIIGIIIMIQARTPDSLGPAGVALFFLLVFGLLAQVVSLLMVLNAYLRGKNPYTVGARTTISFGAALPVIMLLALNTIRQISFIDLSFAIVFGVVLVFYLRRR